MYIVCSRTPNTIAVEVIQNGKSTRVKLEEKFQTTTSEQITEDMERLSSTDPKIISYAEIINPDVTSESTDTESTRRGRKRSSSEENSES